MQVRLSRASAVIVQPVPAAAVDWFLEWQRDVTEAAEGFPGYCGTDVFPPAEGQRDEWVVLIHFDDERALNQWLESPIRAEWLEKRRTKLGAFELKTVRGGFGPWFAGLDRGPNRGPVPSSWQMALTVLLGLYPTVMLLTIFVAPHTAPLGLAVSILIGNALSVSILQWGVMPVLTRLLGPWLQGQAAGKRGPWIARLCLVLLLLAGMAGLFRHVTG